MHLNSSLNNHAHDFITNINENIEANTTPDIYFNSGNGHGVFMNNGLKRSNQIGIGGSYSGILGYSAWGDASGNGAHELAFTDYGELYYRFGKSSWGDWYNIVNSGNISRYALPLTGGDLSGSVDITATSPAVSVGNSIGRVALHTSTSGDRGLYGITSEKWLIVERTNGTIHTPSPATDANDTQIATTAWTRDIIANGADINKVTIDLTDTSKYDASTYYPVYGSILGMARNYRLTCTAVLYACGAPSWSTHDGGFFCHSRCFRLWCILGC